MKSNSESWEDETLGADEKFAKQSELSAGNLDSMTDLQMINVRLPNALVRDLIMIAKHKGMPGCNPLIRETLNRFVEQEKKNGAK
jgi:hypothetical protein